MGPIHVERRARGKSPTTLSRKVNIHIYLFYAVNENASRYCNTILCNMAINCLGKTKRWDEAVVVFERMSTDLAHAPDGMTHSVIINALALVRISTARVTAVVQRARSGSGVGRGRMAGGSGVRWGGGVGRVGGFGGGRFVGLFLCAVVESVLSARTRACASTTPLRGFVRFGLSLAESASTSMTQAISQ